MEPPGPVKSDSSPEFCGGSSLGKSYWPFRPDLVFNRTNDSRSNETRWRRVLTVHRR